MHARTRLLIVVKIGIDSHFQMYMGGDSMFLLFFSNLFFLTELQFLIIICSGTIWIDKKNRRKINILYQYPNI